MGSRGVPSIRKRIVGKHLRRLREDSKWSINDVAINLGLSLSAVDRRETGYTTVSIPEVRAYLDLFQVIDENYRFQMEELTLRCNRRGWWSRYKDHVGQSHVDLADAEDLAREIYCVRRTGLPAVLETEDYARAELELGKPFLEFRGISVEKSLELRMRRREVLNRSDAPTFHALLGEGCLLAQVGGHDVMQEELKHLLDVSEQSNVFIRIMPFSQGHPVSMGRGFFMRFEENLGNTLVLDLDGSFEEDKDLADIRVDKFNEEWETSLKEEETRDYLRRMIVS